MATTIDRLDWTVYNQYALRTRAIEQTNKQLRLDQASSIPPQVQLVDVQPRVAELDMLLGIVPYGGTPWGLFKPPPQLTALRRSPFGFSQIAPSFGPVEKQEKEEDKLEEYTCSSDEEEEERSILLRFVRQKKKINQWLGHIVGRMGQFLQG